MHVGRRLLFFLGTDPATGRPSGWAMVEFESEDAAATVIRDHLAQPFIFGGRTAAIDWAKNQSATSGGGAQQRSRSEKAPSATLFMGSLSFQASEQDVFEIFSEYGSVKRVAIGTCICVSCFYSFLIDLFTGRSREGSPRGFAHVEFFELDSAVAAYEAGLSSPITIQGRPVVLDYQVPRPPKAREW